MIEAIVGPCGSGKTTLVRKRIGELRRQFGGLEVGVVCDNPVLPVELTVAETIEQSALLGGVPKREASLRARSLVDALGLGNVRELSAGGLSAGYTALVALAAAAVRGPKALVIDCVSDHLDAVAAGAAHRLILALAKRGATIVIATRDQVFACRCDKLTRLEAHEPARTRLPLIDWYSPC